MDYAGILIAIIGMFGSSGITGLLTVILQRRWKKKDEAEITPQMIKNLTDKVDTAIEAQKVITKERIRYLGTCYLYANEVSLDDKLNLREMHAAYKNLGGNGDLDEILSEVQKLPLAKTKKG